MVGLVVDLQSYPANVFSFLMTLGLVFVRKRRERFDAPPSEFRAWNAVLIFAIAVNIYLLVLPWIPPSGGINGGDVSFFYATYCVVGIAMCANCFLIPKPLIDTCLSLTISALVYLVWILILPKYKGYTIRQTVDKLSDGAQTSILVKVPNESLTEWDAIHDEREVVRSDSTPPVVVGVTTTDN
jgi:hypothetical protein